MNATEVEEAVFKLSDRILETIDIYRRWAADEL
jgi:hypothetical protein